MLLVDQVISAILWFGLALAVGGLDAAIAQGERLLVWYKAAGRVGKDSIEIAHGTWFGRLKKRLMLPTGWAIAIGAVAYACLGFAAWYPSAFFNPAFNTSTFGILVLSFILGDLLLVALFSPVFYWGKSVFGGLITVVLQFLLTAAAIVLLGLATWLPGSIVVGDIAAFIVLCVYELYLLYQVIYIGTIYADLDRNESAEDSYENL